MDVDFTDLIADVLPAAAVCVACSGPNLDQNPLVIAAFGPDGADHATAIPTVMANEYVTQSNLIQVNYRI